MTEFNSPHPDQKSPIDPASSMNQEQLSRMLSLYVDEEVVEFSKNEVDFANPCYIITTNTGKKYALRVLGVQTPENARYETVIQARLASCGIQTSRYLTLKNGDTVGESEEGFFTLAAYIEGKRPSAITLELVEDFGACLAKIHVALANVPISFNEVQWLNPKNIEIEIGKCGPEVAERYKKLLQGVHFLDKELPKTVIHADFGLGNVFARDGHIETVFDFETAEYSYCIFDIAATYLFFAMDKAYPAELILEHLLRGYNANAAQKITDEERAYLREAMIYVAVACSVWSINRNLPIPAANFLALIS